MSLAYGVAQWSNWPMITSVSGRMPCAGTAAPRVLPMADDTSISSPASTPRRRAVAVLMITPRCPRTLPATSSISWIAALPPAWYCMLLVVSSQNG